MPTCAFLSISNTEGWFIDDDLVHEHLQKLHWDVQNIPWNEPADWNKFDLVVIRSPWDYQHHLKEFLNVLHEIEKSKAILLNSLELVKWNINKNYLFELENKGIELVPTSKKFGLKQSDITHSFEQFQTEELIIKPIIGANADDTFRLSKNKLIDFNKYESLFKDRECMIQPFMQSIIDEGEFSLIYFNGKLVHSILKTVGPQDYRVQEEHGGGVKKIEHPENILVTAADKAMAALTEIPLYARVDLVRTSFNTFALMELELIEPCLYFRFHDTAAAMFADCLHDFWKNRSKT